MTYECRTKTVLFTMEVKKECSELWKQKKISNFGNKRIFRFGSNYVLYEYMYGTYRHTHRSCLQRAAGDFYVYVYIQIRAVGSMMMNVTELLFERTDPDTQIFRVSAVYRTMEIIENILKFGNKRIF